MDETNRLVYSNDKQLTESKRYRSLSCLDLPVRTVAIVHLDIPIESIPFLLPAPNGAAMDTTLSGNDHDR